MMRPKVPNIKAVYSLSNSETDRTYIGASMHLKNRIGCHFSLLKTGNHEIESMQADCNKYGIDSFSYEILYLATTRKDLLDNERYFIHTNKPHYNGLGKSVIGEQKVHGYCISNEMLWKMRNDGVLIQKVATLLKKAPQTIIGYIKWNHSKLTMYSVLGVIEKHTGKDRWDFIINHGPAQTQIRKTSIA